MVKFLGLYDPWGSFLDFAPSVHEAPKAVQGANRRASRGYGEDSSLYVGATPPLPPSPGARGLKRPELDLKRYDLKRPDFEGIWLPIEGY